MFFCVRLYSCQQHPESVSLFVASSCFVSSLCVQCHSWAGCTFFRTGWLSFWDTLLACGVPLHGGHPCVAWHSLRASALRVGQLITQGEKIEDIPKEVLMDCAHLVKANSIQGCKMNNVNVVYTPWSNLKKTADMDVGQIGFHRQKDVKIVTVEKKVNEILNRLEKTKMERFPDLAAEKECRDREERNEKKAQIQEMKRREKEEMKKKREMDELRSYSSLMKVENMSSNQDGNDSDEFM
nr:coiled-coil domain-containing protein 25 isoform X1 [Dasypus novemcinctus]